jgi:hypothetical protein
MFPARKQITTRTEQNDGSPSLAFLVEPEEQARYDPFKQKIVRTEVRSELTPTNPLAS